MYKPKQQQRTRIEKLLYWHLPVEERILVLANLIIDKLDADKETSEQVAQEVTENV